MKKHYWLIALCMPLLLTSCSMYDTLFGEFVIQKTPDTLVLGIEQERTELQYIETDSTYRITRYSWAGGDGNSEINLALYKSMEEFYKRGRRHGIMRMWGQNGQLTHESTWEDGVRIDSFVSWYDNGQLKQCIIYDSIGNTLKEFNYHRNGVKQTDSIVYKEGKRDGLISHFDSLGRVTDIYEYRNDELLSVQIFRDLYKQMDNKVDALYAFNKSQERLGNRSTDKDKDIIPEIDTRPDNQRQNNKKSGFDEVW